MKTQNASLYIAAKWERNPYTRPQEYFWEENDCAVQTLASVLNITYSDAWVRMSKAGRIPRTGTPTRVIGNALSEVQARFIEIGSLTVYDALNTICRTGRWYACSSRHAFAIIDGKLVDHSTKNYRIKYLWLVSSI